jgi:hypothetical protein
MGTDQIKQPREDVDLDVQCADAAQQRKKLADRKAGESNHHALDAEALDDLREAFGPTQYRQVLWEVGAPAARSAVHEPDDIRAVLRVANELASD